MEMTFYLTIAVKVNTELSPETARDEFSTETDYNFSNTDNVTVIDSELLEIS